MSGPARAALERIAEEQQTQAARLLGVPGDAVLPPAGGLTMLPDPLDRQAERIVDEGGKP